MLLRAHRSGFTLIELLTVVAILGVLAAVLLPTVGAVRSQARAAQCASNLRQIGTAILAYANDNRGLLPQVAHLGGPGQEDVSWVRTLRPWLGSADAVRICPADQHAAELLGNRDATSYVLNDLVFTYPGDGDDGVGGPVNPRALARLERVRVPTRTLFAAVINDDIWPRSVTSDHMHAEAWTSWTSVIGDISPDIHRSGFRSVSRDGGRSNYLFGDGHVKSFEAGALRARIEAGENPAVPPS
jgi:prepilin-type N-terminal cleavage/methylation domain-containing protein/prepilin-type processing-associated H-X9-DG protein